MAGNNHGKGFAGSLAEKFIDSRLTIIIAVVSIMMGIFAVVLTPKEEEPQILSAQFGDLMELNMSIQQARHTAAL